MQIIGSHLLEGIMKAPSMWTAPHMGSVEYQKKNISSNFLSNAMQRINASFAVGQN